MLLGKEVKPHLHAFFRPSTYLEMDYKKHGSRKTAKEAPLFIKHEKLHIA